MGMTSGAAGERGGTRKRREAFTLIELLVVVIIIVILVGVVAALMNNFLRGQGVRQGAVIVMQAMARTRQLAAEKHRIHFLVFSPKDKDAWLEIHEDTNGDRSFQGDQDRASKDADRALEEQAIDLPKHVVFEVAPAHIAVYPSGYMGMYTEGGGQFPSIPAASFDAIMNGANPTVIGDVVLRIQNRPYRMCISLDRAAGKVRRYFFHNEEEK